MARKARPKGSKLISTSKLQMKKDHLLDKAILKTIAYADIFDYPLKPKEIHRYMVGMKAPFEAVLGALQNGQLASHYLKSIDGYFMLRGRESIFETRKKRTRVAGKIWPRAVRYGHLIAALPYTRMAAITGALAVSNVHKKADIDYFIVTQPGRVWLCRAFVIILVRLIARTKNDTICPNYIISEETLAFGHHSLYTAHELAQMIPVAGMQVYQDLRNSNPWIANYLPNANGPPPLVISVPAITSPHALRQLVERTLRKTPGDWLETWEMERKIRKFSLAEGGSGEAAFCADWCKGHFENHGKRTLTAYNQRVRELGLVP